MIFGERNLQSLSAGEMRRFFILKSLMHDVDISIIDEPFSNSDKLLFEVIFNAIKGFKNNIVLSHFALDEIYKEDPTIICLDIKNIYMTSFK